jgi:hypothetical protein
MKREVRVLVVSGSTNVRKKQLQAMIDHGMNEYTTKLYSFEDMVKQVQKILGENMDG